MVMMINKNKEKKTVFNLEEETKAWKELLDTGGIDESTYNKEVTRLIQKAEKRKKYKKIEIFDLIKTSSKVLISIIIFVLIIWIYKNNNVKKDIEYVESLNNIQKPRQSATKGNVVKIINGSNVEIDFVASYSISGRVVDVQNYYGYSIQNKLSPKDIGLSWGALASEQNNKKLKWSSLGNRYLSWHSNDGKWISEMGGKNKINEHFSNNHLIPSDDKVKKLISIIKERDYIRIEGYLVNVFCRKNNGSYFYWNTSTSRTDSGNGACEIIYVTDVIWLEEQ